MEMLFTKESGKHERAQPSLLPLDQGEKGKLHEKMIRL
jgi:hypothetical protein